MLSSGPPFEAAAACGRLWAASRELQTQKELQKTNHNANNPLHREKNCVCGNAINLDHFCIYLQIFFSVLVASVCILSLLLN